MANGKPHVHQPVVEERYHQPVDAYGYVSIGSWITGGNKRNGWRLIYGDTQVAIPEAPTLQPEAVQSALAEAIRQHDEGSKELQARDAVLATVGRLKGKKVWASEVLANPPKAGLLRRLIHKE